VEFSYNENDRYGPSNWKDINEQCGGKNQSPIAIDVWDVTVRENAEPLIIDGIDLVPEAMIVENNGHSLKLSFRYANDQKIRISGGPLKNPFILDNIHFHWGADTNGSEHVINDNRYAAEMHMVTYNSIFGKIVI
jgi:carbonic anhydrase